jgi:hypothetical protein
MNQRIKQLAEQAGMYVDLNGNPWPRWMSAEECEVAYKKFAELIVQKCADIGERYADGNYEVRNQILEHFGLEEPEE